MAEPKHKTPQYLSIRVPPPDSRTITAMADIENRTVNNMAVTLLKEAIVARKDPQ